MLPVISNKEMFKHKGNQKFVYLHFFDKHFDGTYFSGDVLVQAFLKMYFKIVQKKEG